MSKTLLNRDCLPGKELKMFDEHSQFMLKRPLPSLGLETGNVGVVVHPYAEDAAYEVEFVSLDGNSIDVTTVEATELKRAKQNGLDFSVENRRPLTKGGQPGAVAKLVP